MKNSIFMKLMRVNFKIFSLALLVLFVFGCKKKENDTIKNTDTSLSFTVNGSNNGTLKYTGLNLKPTIKFSFTEAIDPNSIAIGAVLTDKSGNNVSFNISVQNTDKSLTIIPQNDFDSFSTYTLTVNNKLTSSSGGKLINPVTKQYLKIVQLAIFSTNFG